MADGGAIIVLRAPCMSPSYPHVIVKIHIGMCAASQVVISARGLSM
jgi:hypothetical protein